MNNHNPQRVHRLGLDVQKVWRTTKRSSHCARKLFKDSVNMGCKSFRMRMKHWCFKMFQDVSIKRMLSSFVRFHLPCVSDVASVTAFNHQCKQTRHEHLKPSMCCKQFLFISPLSNSDNNSDKIELLSSTQEPKVQLPEREGRAAL